jgi:hypothetical protein
MGLAGLVTCVRLRAPRTARARAALIALAVASILLLTLSPASSQAASRGFFGIAAGAQSMDGRDFSKMRSGGVDSFRFNVNWAGIQPSKDTHNWSRVDQVMGAAAAHGIRPLPVVISSPAWVTRKPLQPPVGSKAKIRAWRAFLADAVRRYGRHGSYWKNGYRVDHPGAKPKPVRAWQLWNEPNLRKFFATKHSVRDYAKLVKAAHKAIGKVDRRADVVLAGLSSAGKPSASRFLARLYRVKRFKRSFDAAALHPYAASIRKYRGEIQKMRRVMNKRRDRHAGLWLTEVGWGSDRHSRSRPLNKGRRGQKRMLQKSFRLTLHKRKRWHVQGLYWFDFRDPPKNTGGCTFCDSAGLLKHSRKPKPAFRAFKHIAR